MIALGGVISRSSVFPASTGQPPHRTGDIGGRSTTIVRSSLHPRRILGPRVRSPKVLTPIGDLVALGVLDGVEEHRQE